MSISSPLDRLLDRWRRDSAVASNIMDWHIEPERAPDFVEVPPDLHVGIRAALQSKGINSLYRHQVNSWQSVRSGQNLVVVTGTASGKTLCYNLPVLDTTLRDQDAAALYFFPTKALAQDQKQQLSELSRLVTQTSGLTEVPVAVYDGDTPANQRSTIRTNARVLLTNPDMLHMGILPHHTLWADFLRRLRYVVIDEIHVYRGVFGSHVANVIRRLKRIARFYGAHPQFILTSATIANPGEHAQRLIEEPVAVVDRDGSPRGPRHFLIYNPPVIDASLGLRASSLTESVRLTDDLLAYDVQTLVFSRTRRTVELILTSLRGRHSSRTSTDNERTAASEIHGYRSGYLAEERRSIERGLREGETRAVVSTNALELGVDIGSAGAVILVGYPGSIAATRQQSGRAGRRLDPSVALLVASPFPLDQFLVRHPEYLYDSNPEQALINPDNLMILYHHLRCAAFELPFGQSEPFGSLALHDLQDIRQALVESGELHPSGDRFFWTADQYPANQISLRSADANTVALQAEVNGRTTTVGEVDGSSALWMVHPNAIYIHEGRTFEVRSLNLEDSRANLVPVNVDYFTTPSQEVSVEKISASEEQLVTGGGKGYGEILVTSQVVGYKRVLWQNHHVLSAHALEMPATHLRTIGYWLYLSESSVNRLRDLGLWKSDPIDYGPNWIRQRNLARQRDEFHCQICGISEGTVSHHVHHKIPFRTFTSYEVANQLENLVTLCPTCHRKAETAVRMRTGLSGLSYVLQNIAPLFVMCDIADLDVHADPESTITAGQPTVVLYDRMPAGIGLCENLYHMHDDLLRRCYELVLNCTCFDGCPSCVGPSGENGTGGKLETLAVLAILTGLPVPAQHQP
jgi:DEAD/DEAH box helicase domain-containing protein